MNGSIGAGVAGGPDNHRDRRASGDGGDERARADRHFLRQMDDNMPERRGERRGRLDRFPRGANQIGFVVPRRAEERPRFADHA